MVITLVLLAACPLIQAALPDCEAPPWRDFDFWLGEWDVTEADGQTAGRNVISREQRGCVLVEQLQRPAGSTSAGAFAFISGWVFEGTADADDSQ